MCALARKKWKTYNPGQVATPVTQTVTWDEVWVEGKVLGGPVAEALNCYDDSSDYKD